jgi:adenylate cyclase
VVVRKVRQLLMLGPTRIHLDHVEDLGNFVEFESLVSRSNNVAKAAEHVERLRAGIAATLGEPIAGSYSDLLATELESEGVR